MPKMEYTEALDRLHGLYRFGIWEGLERIERLLQRLGHPEQAVPHYIHVAGTNGKGSVSAMLASVSREAGLRTGLFTSPHLHDHRERYRIDGRMIDQEIFAQIFSQVLEEIDAMTAAGEDSPTEFEAATALAFSWFAREHTDMVVLEVGLGGNADSTNVIVPDVSVITNVGLDHLAHLGDTVEKIAVKKAGIIKPNRPVITGAEGSALAVLEEKAKECNAPILRLGQEIQAETLSMDESGSHIRLHTPGHTYPDLFLPLLGPYQINNAALAVTAAELAGFTPEQIQQGLLKVRWPGRLEIISREPLILLDGAHNQPGMAALARAIECYWPGKRILAVLGMFADKQREEALPQLLPLLEHTIITPPNNPERAGDWTHLAEICEENGVGSDCIQDNREACIRALEMMEQGEYDMLLVSGSLYLLAELRAILLDMISPGWEQEMAAL